MHKVNDQICFVLNPFKNHEWKKDGSLVVWDNVDINKYKVRNSQTLYKYLEGQNIDSVDDILLLKSLIKKMINRSELVEKKELSITLSEHYLEESIIKFETKFGVKVQVWSGCFNEIDDKQDYILLNPYGHRPVLGPFIKKNQNVINTLKYTWSSAIYSSHFEKNLTTMIDIKKVVKLLENANDVKTLEKCIISYEKNVIKHYLDIMIDDLYVQSEDSFIGENNFITSKEGGYRSSNQFQLLEKLRKIDDPITGLIDNIEYDKIAGFHCYKCYSKLAFLLGGKFEGYYSMGKGRTKLQAELSGLGEIIERFYSLVIEHSLPIESKTISNLDQKLIDPKSLQLWSSEQFKKSNIREENNFFKKVPYTLTEDQKIDWVDVFCLNDLNFYKCPADFCFHPSNEQSLNYVTYSNGVAAGSTNSEAILQGLFELIERDCAAIWWYNKLNVDGLDISSIDLSEIREAHEFYIKKGYKFHLLDISFDHIVKTYVAIAFRENQPLSIRIGFGTHIDNDIALVRATSELVQFEYSLKDGMLDKEFMNIDVNEAFLRPSKQKKYNPNNSVDKLNTSFDKVIREIVEHLELLGHKTYYLNLTRKDSLLNIVRVIVPGLRSFLYEMGPGRLYDVPKKFGFVDTEKNTYVLDL